MSDQIYQIRYYGTRIENDEEIPNPKNYPHDLTSSTFLHDLIPLFDIDNYINRLDIQGLPGTKFIIKINGDVSYTDYGFVGLTGAHSIIIPSNQRITELKIPTDTINRIDKNWATDLKYDFNLNDGIIITVTHTM